MIGHLGARVSALLDGQLSASEAEEAWRHVYGCHACRDLVEREGWVKSRLAGLARGADVDSPASHALKGSLLNLTPGETFLGERGRGSRRMNLGIGAAAVGGGAVGAALLGVVALGIAPGSGAGEQRPPVTQIGNTSPSATTNGAARPRRHPAGGLAGADTGLSQVVARQFR